MPNICYSSETYHLDPQDLFILKDSSLSDEVNVSDEVLAQRKAKWQPPVQNLTGYLKRYAQHVTSGAKGAVFED